jgi:phage tail protein
MATSWRSLRNFPQTGLRNQTSDPSNSVLYTWGPLQFTVIPFNVHEFDHETDTDWAQKEIAGAAIYREWVGENDETIYLRGKLFPYRIGGMKEIEIFEANRRAGLAQLLLRGGNPGTKLGWYVCEKLVRSNTFLSGEGLGQQIAFEAAMARVPTPSENESLFSSWVAVGNINMG